MDKLYKVTVLVPGGESCTDGNGNVCPFWRDDARGAPGYSHDVAECLLHGRSLRNCRKCRDCRKQATDFQYYPR